MAGGSSSRSGALVGNQRTCPATGVLTPTAVGRSATTAGGRLCRMSRGHGPAITMDDGQKSAPDAAGHGFPGRFGPLPGCHGDKVKTSPVSVGRHYRQRPVVMSTSGSVPPGSTQPATSVRSVTPSSTSAILVQTRILDVAAFTNAGAIPPLLLIRS